MGGHKVTLKRLYEVVALADNPSSSGAEIRRISAQGGSSPGQNPKALKGKH
jgi:hypothetical protein